MISAPRALRAAHAYLQPRRPPLAVRQAAARQRRLAAEEELDWDRLLSKGLTIVAFDADEMQR